MTSHKCAGVRFFQVGASFLLMAIAVCAFGVQERRSEAGDFLEVKGGRLYYEVAGKGCPVVLIAGAGGMDGRQWSAQVDFLRRRYRTILFEPRGSGKSSVAQEPYSDVDDLLAVLDKLSIRKATLVGVSSAGGIAIDFAVSFPQRVEGLVLAAPMVRGFQMSAEQQARVARFAQASQAGVEEGIRAFMQDAHFVPAPRNPQARRRAETLMRENVRSGPAVAAKPLNPPAVTRLGEIQSPTLLLIGALDHPDLHRRVDFLKERIAKSQKTVLSDAGHMSNLENPAAFNRALGEFLGKNRCARE